MKRILILTAGFGEGHNSAARGVRAGLARVAPKVEVELRDLFPETYGAFNEIVRRAYLALINRWPKSWGYVYNWLDRKKDFDQRFEKFHGLKKNLGRLLDRFQPDVVVSTFPPYPYLIDQIIGNDRRCKNVAIVTDSITVNAIWYRSPADYFLVANEQSATVVRDGGVSPERIKVFGFPVSPRFADFTKEPALSDSRTGRDLFFLRKRVIYIINAGTRRAPDLVRKLLELNIHLTVTVGRDERLHRAIEKATRDHKSRLRQDGAGQVDVIGWTDEMPRLLCESHLLIGKAGGAMVQETIAARCPMIVNHVVSGQEEGNARLIVETNSGAIALSNDEVVTQVQRAFDDNAKQWREWSTNISKLSRPRASLDIAEFLLSI